ncbi:hypothetical protein KW439_10435 [Vibrio fluvialis]|nr:hypothetical protein [Vibrio fluvialis]
MSRKPISEKELLEGMTPKTEHADELATTSEKGWGSYSKVSDIAESDFLVQRDDIVNKTRMEKCYKCRGTGIEMLAGRVSADQRFASLHSRYAASHYHDLR